WRDDIAEYHGEFVDFPPTWSWPKPNGGRVPVLIGGAPGPKLFAHVAEYADGWMPIGGSGIRSSLPALQAACAARGRELKELRIVPFGTIPDPGKVEYYASLGIEEVVLRLPGGDADRVLPVLDKYATLAEDS
ncbi:MAG TPA: LLM class flavin-dependent oxidoreductase, partial [Acidimicrobiia bacterium]|nr:LLM class flavin-dependent oxidoreductase [Acidimicrobiia bacterium]